MKIVWIFICVIAIISCIKNGEYGTIILFLLLIALMAKKRNLKGSFFRVIHIQLSI